jgi:hypothetical protein
MQIIRRPQDWIIAVPRHFVKHGPTGLLYQLDTYLEPKSDAFAPEHFTARLVNPAGAADLRKDELALLGTEALLMGLFHMGIIDPKDVTTKEDQKSAA